MQTEKQADTITKLRQDLLDCLEPIEQTAPWGPMPDASTFEGEPYTDDQIEAELMALVDEGIVDTKDDPHSGMKSFALTSALDAPEYLAAQNDYDWLKKRTITAAEAKGYAMRWREGEGWTLRDASGETVQFGPMREIARFLGVADEVAA